MLKAIIITLAILVSSSALAEPDRIKFAKSLTESAQQNGIGLEFWIDPNNDTTLAIKRYTSMKPSELQGDWTMYLSMIGKSVEELKQNGFNKVRIYTSKSKDISDYVLKIL